MIGAVALAPPSAHPSPNGGESHVELPKHDSSAVEQPWWRFNAHLRVLAREFTTGVAVELRHRIFAAAPVMPRTSEDPLTNIPREQHYPLTSVWSDPLRAIGLLRHARQVADLGV